MQEAYPSEWHRNEEENTRVRTLRLMDELAGEVSSMAHGLNVYHENRRERAHFAAILVSRIAANLARLDTLKAVREHAAEEKAEAEKAAPRRGGAAAARGSAVPDDGLCHRQGPPSGDCSLGKDHWGYCDWEGK